MTTRLPTPGGDDNRWGDILNSFLEVAHNADGTLQTTALVASGAVTSVNGKAAQNGGVTLTADDLNVLTESAGDSRYQQIGNYQAAGNYATLVKPSGDTTGAQDTATIKTALTSQGVAILQPGQLYYVNEQLVIPNNGGLVTLAGHPAIIRQAAGTNLAVPFVASQNFVNPVGGTPSAAPFTHVIANVVIDVNCTQQNYSGQAWLTAGIKYLNGPDGLTVNVTKAHIQDVQVWNPVRHGIVTCDASAGSNTVNGYSGVGVATAGNVNGMSLRYKVLGWGLLSGTYQYTCTGTMTANSKTITGVSGTKAAGMTIFGPGVAPNTWITAVSGSTITLSQNVCYNATGTFYTTWGQRGRWSTGVGDGCTDGVEQNCEIGQMNGDFALYIGSSGGWQFDHSGYWGCAYSGARFNATQNAYITNCEWGGNLGQNPIEVTTVSQTLTGGIGYSSLAVAPMPVALGNGTVLLLRSGGGSGSSPLIVTLDTACNVGDTTLRIWYTTAAANIASGAGIYIPMIGGQRIGYIDPPVDEGNIANGPEDASTDYIGHVWMPPSNMNTATNNGVGWTSSALSTGAAITSIPVRALANAVPAGAITIGWGYSTQTFTTIGATAGATSLPITSATPNYAYPTLSTLTVSSNTWAQSIGTQIYQNTGVTAGATSTAFAYLGTGGTWTIRGTNLHINQGQTQASTYFVTSGSGTTLMPDGLPGQTKTTLQDKWSVHPTPGVNFAWGAAATCNFAPGITGVHLLGVYWTPNGASGEQISIKVTVTFNDGLVESFGPGATAGDAAGPIDVAGDILSNAFQVGRYITGIQVFASSQSSSTTATPSVALYGIQAA